MAHECGKGNNEVCERFEFENIPCHVLIGFSSRLFYFCLNIIISFVDGVY